MMLSSNVSHVHRAAKAAADTVSAAEQFCHHFGNVGAFGNAVSVAAVMCGNEVATQKRIAGAGRHCLLTDRGMRGALDETGLEKFGRARLERTDQKHGLQQLLQLGIVELWYVPYWVPVRFDGFAGPRRRLSPFFESTFPASFSLDRIWILHFPYLGGGQRRWREHLTRISLSFRACYSFS